MHDSFKWLHPDLATDLRKILDKIMTICSSRVVNTNQTTGHKVSIISELDYKVLEQAPFLLPINTNWLQQLDKVCGQSMGKILLNQLTLHVIMSYIWKVLLLDKFMMYMHMYICCKMYVGYRTSRSISLIRSSKNCYWGTSFWFSTWPSSAKASRSWQVEG